MMVTSKSYHENLQAAYPETKIPDMDAKKTWIKTARDRGRGRSGQVDNIEGIKKERIEGGIQPNGG